MAAAEDVVGRHMDERQALRDGRRRHCTGTAGIDGKRPLTIGLGGVDGGVGRGVDDTSFTEWRV